MIMLSGRTNSRHSKSSYKNKNGWKYDGELL